jgi:hypothetical protein
MNNKQTNEQRKQRDRPGLFHSYLPSYSWEKEGQIGRRARLAPPSEDRRTGFEFLLEVKEISFELGLVEPFFLSFFVVDLASKSRVSELFHVDLNPPVYRRLVQHCQGFFIFAYLCFFIYFYFIILLEIKFLMKFRWHVMLCFRSHKKRETMICG